MKNSEHTNQKNALQYLLELAKPCKGLLISSVIFAVLGAASGIVPFDLHFQEQILEYLL